MNVFDVGTHISSTRNDVGFFQSGDQQGELDFAASAFGPQRLESRVMPMSKKITARDIKLKRAYQRATASDGKRILVDRLWPRGLKKADAAIDHWVKDLSPSTDLRKWFGHDPARWQEFRQRYAREVQQHREQLRRLRALARERPITLVFSAHDEVHNDAVALRDMLLGRHLKK